MDRSISPADRAYVMPNAMIETKAVWRRMLSWFSTVRNPLSRRITENARNRSRKPR
jgi:hypothetical protein